MVTFINCFASKHSIKKVQLLAKMVKEANKEEIYIMVEAGKFNYRCDRTLYY